MSGTRLVRSWGLFSVSFPVDDKGGVRQKVDNIHQLLLGFHEGLLGPLALS